MGYITYTKGTEWWISRVNHEGHERYPKAIEVGGVTGPTIRYEPVYTARKLRTGFSGQVQCSQYSIFNPKENSYCRKCGARFEEVDG